jgi:hypothetical protein
MRWVSRLAGSSRWHHSIQCTTRHKLRLGTHKQQRGTGRQLREGRARVHDTPRRRRVQAAFRRPRTSSSASATSRLLLARERSDEPGAGRRNGWDKLRRVGGEIVPTNSERCVSAPGDRREERESSAETADLIRCQGDPVDDGPFRGTVRSKQQSPSHDDEDRRDEEDSWCDPLRRKREWPPSHHREKQVDARDERDLRSDFPPRSGVVGVRNACSF